MPAIHTKTIKTMRDIWDGERKAVQKQKESAVFLRSRIAVGKQADVRPEDSVPREEGLAKARKYFLEYLELKRVVMDFFPDYQMYLGEGGFTKI